jgi:hypothetical protein
MEKQNRRKDRRKRGKTIQGACGVSHRRFFVTLCQMAKQNRRKDGKTDGNVERQSRHLRHFAQEVFCHTVLNGKTEQTERRKDRRKRGKTIKAPAAFCTGGFLSHCVKWKNRTDGKTERRKDRRKRGKTIKVPAVFCTGGFLSHCVKWMAVS